MVLRKQYAKELKPICRQLQIAPSDYYEHKHVNETLTGYRIASSGTRCLEATYEGYGRIIYKFTV
jgi:hypothetical protein